MAIVNNIYFNAALTGFVAGAVSGRKISSTTATDYATLVTAGVAFATAVDALIAFDATVTTAGPGVTQLAITTNTIAANEQWRAGALHAICKAYWENSYTVDATIADNVGPANACFALWTQVKTALIIP